MTELIIYGNSNWLCYVVRFERPLKIGSEEPDETYFRSQYRNFGEVTSCGL